MVFDEILHWPMRFDDRLDLELSDQSSSLELVLNVLRIWKPEYV